MMGFHLNGMSSMWMFGIFFMLMVAYIISRDANSNGEDGTMWFFIVLFLPMMGLFLYLIIRSTNRSQNRINASNYDKSNFARTTPPIVEPVRTRPSTPVYDTKSKNQNLSEFHYCTNCGFQNTLDATYCKSCGTKLL